MVLATRKDYKASTVENNNGNRRNTVCFLGAADYSQVRELLKKYNKHKIGYKDYRLKFYNITVYNVDNEKPWNAQDGDIVERILQELLMINFKIKKTSAFVPNTNVLSTWKEIKFVR